MKLWKGYALIMFYLHYGVWRKLTRLMKSLAVAFLSSEFHLQSYGCPRPPAPTQRPSFALAFDVMFLFSRFWNLVLVFLICFILCLLWSEHLRSVCSLGKKKSKFKFQFPVVSDVVGCVGVPREAGHSVLFYLIFLWGLQYGSALPLEWDHP